MFELWFDTISVFYIASQHTSTFSHAPCPKPSLAPQREYLLAGNVLQKGPKLRRTNISQ